MKNTEINLIFKSLICLSAKTHTSNSEWFFFHWILILVFFPQRHFMVPMWNGFTLKINLEMQLHFTPHSMSEIQNM